MFVFVYVFMFVLRALYCVHVYVCCLFCID